MSSCIMRDKPSKAGYMKKYFIAVIILGICCVPKAEATLILDTYMFYNNSAYDSLSDEDAISPVKQALVPGQTASSSHFTNYYKGLNGVGFDIVGLSDPSAVSLSDFIFQAGNSADPSAWGLAPAPASLAVDVGAGTGGSDRFYLTWADHAIENQWLQMTVLANATTELAAHNFYYFGNLVGDVNEDGTLAAIDSLLLINRINAIAAEASPDYSTDISDPMDINKDGYITPSDTLIVINSLNQNPGNPPALNLFTAPFNPVLYSGDIPNPIPEPSTLLLFAVGMLATFAKIKE